jgi:hypothetical protein
MRGIIADNGTFLVYSGMVLPRKFYRFGSTAHTESAQKRAFFQIHQIKISGLFYSVEIS